MSRHDDPEPKPKSFMEQSRSNFNLAYVFCKVYTACFTPFLRAGMGTHAMAWTGPMALVLMFFGGGLTGRIAIIYYIPVWLVAVIVQRFLQDRWMTSTYDGRPALMMRVFRCKTEQQGRAAEILFVQALGLILLVAGAEPQSALFSLGGFLFFGCFAMAFKEGVEREITKTMVRQMRDASLAQRNLAEWVRHEERYDG
jgi:hypothetical protein